MAVFLVNNCTFQGCGLTFSTLADLIQHIEDTHIDTDPRSLEIQEEDKPPSLPLSYVLRFYTDADRREQYDIQKKQRLRAHSPAVSLPESTPTESEVDEESIKSDNDDSDDSWTTQEDFPSDVILNMMGGRERDMEGDRPYGCPVPGCKKRYKNVNGIKYHARHGHKNEASKVKKSYRCFCGKSYRSVQGLRTHTSLQHPSSSSATTTEFTTPTPPPIAMVTTATGVVMSPPPPPNVSVSSTGPMPVPTMPNNAATTTTSIAAATTSSTTTLLNSKDSSSISPLLGEHLSALHHGGGPLPITPRLATLTPSRLLSHKVAAAAHVKGMVKGQGQATALTLPLGTPVQFIGQPASVVPVPVPVAVKSVVKP
ncbi:uncharacterized protein LOC143276428 [Babylonia areolata]|uniref:uncharacterized protein LOC143276428 n=1 Tax=Babylonia areolata TaxID=304850 RepID=UPI003FD5EF34